MTVVLITCVIDRQKKINTQNEVNLTVLLYTDVQYKDSGNKIDHSQDSVGS